MGHISFRFVSFHMEAGATAYAVSAFEQEQQVQRNFRYNRMARDAQSDVPQYPGTDVRADILKFLGSLHEGPTWLCPVSALFAYYGAKFIATGEQRWWNASGQLLEMFAHRAVRHTVLNLLRQDLRDAIESNDVDSMKARKRFAMVMARI